jgi:hypothetical protein
LIRLEKQTLVHDESEDRSLAEQSVKIEQTPHVDRAEPGEQFLEESAIFRRNHLTSTSDLPHARS